MPSRRPIILASGSAARKSMLLNAGLAFTTIPSEVDEAMLVEGMMDKHFSCSAMALELARAKAKDVSKDHPDAVVIGSDQVLECAGQMMTKAVNANDAHDKLLNLKGKTHKLISAVCAVVGGEVIWETIDDASLRMHDFDETFLRAYIKVAGDALTTSVGAYKLEHAGSWLFDKVDGDYFTILGMPLLPLLGFLRTSEGLNP